MHLFECLPDSSSDTSPWEMLGTQTKGNILEDVQMRKEDVILKDVAERTFLRGHYATLIPVKIGQTIQGDMSTLRVRQACDMMQDCTFSCPTLSKQDRGFSCFR